MSNLCFKKSEICKKVSILAIGAFLVLLLANEIITIKTVQAADTEIPTIMPRSVWDNTKELHDLLLWIPDRKNTAPPDYAKVERIVIHDAGCSLSNPACNSDTVDPISVIQSIYRNHTIFRGWGDIGYNYLIDRKGNIYEGRFGGNGVRGAHTYYDRKCINFNVGTAGIMLMGNYSERDMPEAMYKSLEKLVGWIGANNNIDPSDIKRTTPVWYNPKKDNGKCDTADGSFGTAYTAPAVIGHGDIEAGNSDPGVVDLKRVRKNTAVYFSAYKKNVYKVTGISPYWVIENGERVDFVSEEAIRKAGYLNYTVINISSGQLEFYPSHSSYKYPDGTLIRAKDLPVIYLIEEGSKRPLNITVQEFEKLGFKWDQVVVLIAKDISLYPDGNPVKFAAPEDALIMESGSSVYKIENGRKRWITSLRLFETLGYKWNNVKVIPRGEILGYLEGAWMVYPDNILIKGSDGNVYKILDSERHLVTSLSLFDKLKLKWSNVKSVADFEIDAIKEGKPLAYPDSLLVKLPEEINIYLTRDAKRHLIGSDYLFKKLGYKLKDVLQINAEEMAALPEAEPVKYPNGTLLRPFGGIEVYVVEKGERRWVQTAEDFKKKGYKWQDIIDISPIELSYYSLTGTVPASYSVLIPDAPSAISYSTIVSPLSFSPMLVPTPILTPVPVPAASIPAPTPTSVSISMPMPNTVSSSIPLMRVAIYSSQPSEAVSVTADGNYYAKNYNSKNELASNVKKSEGEITAVNYFTEGYWRFEPESDNVAIKLISYSDVPSWNKTLNDNEFKGTIEIRYSNVSNKLWVINELSLEDYADGIGEALNSDNAEYLKAFALAARTYAKYYIDKGGKYAGEPFYLKNSRDGNGNDQIYRGYGFAKRANNIIGANHATQGEIITFIGKPIVAAYSSDSGGITKDACKVLSQTYCNEDYSYIRGGVKDPDSTAHNESIVAISHGAGISAVGARQMAKEGKNYQEIILHYYPGVKIEKLY